MSIQLGTNFNTMTMAKGAITSFVNNADGSFITLYSNKHRFEDKCKTLKTSSFRIKTPDSKKHGIHITHFVPHQCNPGTDSDRSHRNSIAHPVPHLSRQMFHQ